MKKTIESAILEAFLESGKMRLRSQIFPFLHLWLKMRLGPFVFHIAWSAKEKMGRSAERRFFSIFPRGTQAKICGRYAENLVRVFRYPPTIFFHELRFFPQHFQVPPIFFRKCKFFRLKFGDLPTFLRKIHIYLFFDPLTSKYLSVFESLFRDIQLFDEF